MVDLATFANEVGHFRVWSFWGTLRIRYSGQTIRFTPQGEDVRVRGPAIRGRCVFKAALSRWIFQPDDGTGIILFDHGLSVIMEQGLRVTPAKERL
jgi:hypothetical protein